MLSGVLGVASQQVLGSQGGTSSQDIMRSQTESFLRRQQAERPSAELSAPQAQFNPTRERMVESRPNEMRELTPRSSTERSF